jgi:long-chain acyl-CoA synthetase
VNIVDMIDRYLADYGDRIRAIDRTGGWTGARLSERARRLAGTLRAYGVGRGDRVGVMMANSAEVFIAYEAAWRAGAAITPIMPALVEGEVAHILLSASPAAVIASDGLAEKVRDARARAGSSFVLISDEEGDVTLADAQAGPMTPEVPCNDADLAALLFTGGTTGRSKGVMLSHRNLAATVRIAATGVETLPDDLSLVTLPLSHGFGIVVFLVTFLDPLCLLVRRRFDPLDFAITVEREGVTMTDAVPSMLQALLDSGHAHSGALRSLRSVYVGGSYCPPDLLEAFEQATGARVFEGYGLTESGALIAGDVPSRPHRRGSVGRPYEGVQVHIVGSDGTAVPPGQVGEVVARSEAMMRGYWSDEAATADAIRDGWLYTGDLGSQDEDGYLRIVGRRKELIIRGGFNIHPTDLENVIRECPGVNDVCVFGTPDRALGERLIAAVVGSCTAEDVERHCHTAVAGHKRPDHIVMLDELPRTRVGKPARKTLAIRLGPSIAAASSP